MAAFQAAKEGVDGGDGSTVRLDPDNNVQPDAFLRKLVGTSRLTADDYLEGAPELVFEIAASSAAIDLGPKRDVYLRGGVQEYIVWQLYENRLDWFSREGDAYVPLAPDARGVIHSKVFAGLKLAVSKLLARDLAGVLREQNRRERARRP
jgi:Uma2 family endonuclease